MSDEDNQYLTLFEASVVPRRVCLVSLTWGLHDYFLTLEDEMVHVWPTNFNFAKFMFFWIRYYTLVLLLFDVVQIHVFAIPGIPSDNLCVAMDAIIRVTGALSLWAVEIIMQLRVFALYDCSKRIGIINFVLFLASIAGFLWILVHNAQRRREVIADAMAQSVVGCPSIHTGIEWAQWVPGKGHHSDSDWKYIVHPDSEAVFFSAFVPATAYEGLLFGYAVYKTFESNLARMVKGKRISLYSVLLRDNLLYFFGIACILVFNNLMVIVSTSSRVASYYTVSRFSIRETKRTFLGLATVVLTVACRPFHAAVGILTTRMVLNIRKAATRTTFWSSFALPRIVSTESSPSPVAES
ncbi:hypothetical protein GYMLUDRAFT_257732 [Collybiopsis luxurians FD-317 M1]|nr:hypothetical protein GYMLUDRAFT_257732 [Collybiopsis luxurians FD-317 M1]